MEQYEGFDQTEENMRQRMLRFVQDYPDCFKRELLIGHITGSCWVIDPVNEKVLLLHHAKLNKWLQPGGHCDGNENVAAVAQTELFEETGLDVKPVSTTFFDLDIHTIPERKGVPEHEHFDVRFLFHADERMPLIQNHETNGLKWIPLNEIHKLTEERSVLRMQEKSIR